MEKRKGKSDQIRAHLLKKRVEYVLEREREEEKKSKKKKMNTTLCLSWLADIKNNGHIFKKF